MMAPYVRIERGRFVDASVYDACARLLERNIAKHAFTGEAGVRKQEATPQVRIVCTADTCIVSGVVTQTTSQRLVAAINRELTYGEWLQTPRARTEHRAALLELICHRARGRDREETEGVTPQRASSGPVSVEDV